jgi:hypothetical protein
MCAAGECKGEANLVVSDPTASDTLDDLERPAAAVEIKVYSAECRHVGEPWTPTCSGGRARRPGFCRSMDIIVEKKERSEVNILLKRDFCFCRDPPHPVRVSR